MRPEQTIHVFINKQKFELASSVQTGAALKTLAGIPLADALFLQQPGDDLIITNDASISLRNGSQLHSQPPADYGVCGVGASALTPELLAAAGLDPAQVEIHEGPDGWSFLVVSGYRVPGGYAPAEVRLLLKLSPSFPDGAPDMFWVLPALRTPSGTPRATSTERLLGEDWQRFSWHLAPGAWIPGVSTLRDFLRCVAARFQKLD